MKKKTIKLFAILLSLNIFSCGKKTMPLPAQIEYRSQETSEIPSPIIANNDGFALYNSFSFQKGYLKQSVENRKDAYSNKPSQELIDDLYQKLEIVNRVLKENNINYTIISGTLLGAIRNGGLIPNDDDIDIAIMESESQKLYSLREKFSAEGFKLVYDEIGMKLYKENQTKGAALDIFFLNYNETKMAFEYHTTHLQQVFPKDYIESISANLKEYLIEYNFGPLKVSGINHYMATNLFNNAYGKNWFTETYKMADHNSDEVILKRVVIRLNYFDYYHLTPQPGLISETAIANKK